MKEYPFVTAMIVARNEEKYIEKCFRSLLQQSYPADKYEVLIIDGLSDDNTIAIAKETEKKYACRHVNGGNKEIKVQVKYFDNPQKLLAAGWNMGIREASGDYVVRIDAHGYTDHNFILKSVETIQAVNDAACVGGSMRTEALTPRGQLIAGVLSSPFGVGNSKFRYSQRPQYVDTVAFGLYKKEIFHQVGFFDENLERNQDNDMHRRIRESGGKFYLNPEIKSIYHPRETIKSMMKQGFNNGKWNIVTFRKDPKSLSTRHLVPLFFVLGILGCAILGLFSQFFWWLLCGVIMFYFILAFAFTFMYSSKLSEVFKMPALYFLLHLSYGTGSLASILKNNYKVR